MKLTDHHDDYVRQFAYGPEAGAIVHAGCRAAADVFMDERVEGWIGIPHGGISMGIMMDLAMTLDAYPRRDDLRYPVSCDEKLLFFGRGDRVRGRTSSRLLYWASGGAAAVGEDGRLEMVVSASGQWYGLQDLTRQMKSSLLPRTLTEKLFALAAVPEGK